MKFAGLCGQMFEAWWGLLLVQQGQWLQWILSYSFSIMYGHGTQYTASILYHISYGNIDSILVQPGKWKLGLLLTEVEISMDTNILSIGCQLNILGGGQIFGEFTWMLSNMSILWFVWLRLLSLWFLKKQKIPGATVPTQNEDRTKHYCKCVLNGKKVSSKFLFSFISN